MNICYLVRRAHIIIDIDKIWSMLWQSDCTLDERCQSWYLVPIHIDGFHTIMRNTLGRDSDYDVFINSQVIGGSYHIVLSKHTDSAEQKHLFCRTNSS